MKKQILAAAVAAAVVAPAFAQSTVTIGGRFDVGYSNQSNTAYNAAGTTKTETSQAGFSNGSGSTANGALTSSRIFIRGSEDLGGGLKANMYLEERLTSTGLVADQMAYAFAGISGSFGEIRIGRDDTPSFYASVPFDPTNTNNTAGAGLFTGATTLNTATGYFGTHTHTLGNGVGYISPNMNGLVVRLAMGQADSKTKVNSATTTESKLDVTGIGLSYSAGPLALAAAYHDINGKTLTPATAGSIDLATATAISGDPPAVGVDAFTAPVAAVNTKTTRDEQVLSGSYDFGVAKVFATRWDVDQKEKVGDVKITNATWRYGVQVPLGAVTLIGQRVDQTQKTKTGSATTAKWTVDGYQVGALYSFSKRTTGYLLVGNVDRKYGLSAKKTDNTDGTSIGIRHDF